MALSGFARPPTTCSENIGHRQDGRGGGEKASAPAAAQSAR